MLLAKPELVAFDLILRERMLRWFGHEKHSSGAARTACDIQVDARWVAQYLLSLLFLNQNLSFWCSKRATGKA